MRHGASTASGTAAAAEIHEAAGGAPGATDTPLRADAAPSPHSVSGGLRDLADSQPLPAFISGANTGVVTVDATTGKVVGADDIAAKFLGAPASSLIGRVCNDCYLPPLSTLAESATGKCPPLSCVTPTMVLEATTRTSLSTAASRQVVEVTLHDPSGIAARDDSSASLGNAPRGVVFSVIGILLLTAIASSGSLGIAYASFANAGELTAEIKLAVQCRYLLAGVATYALELAIGGTSPIGTHEKLAKTLIEYSSELVATRHLVRACGQAHLFPPRTNAVPMLQLMYGGLWKEDDLLMTGFINRESLQELLSFGTIAGAFNISSILAASGDASLRGIDDYIVAVADAANVIAARPATASVGMNATALASDQKLQFILRAHAVCVRRAAKSSQ